MRKTRMILAGGAMCVLGACSTVVAVLGTSVTAKQVYDAANAWGVVEASATTYIAYCTPKTPPAGCSDAVVQQLIPGVRAGNTARRNALAAVTAANGQPVDAGLLTALTTATSTLSQIETQNDIGAAK